MATISEEYCWSLPRAGLRLRRRCEFLSSKLTECSHWSRVVLAPVLCLTLFVDSHTYESDKDAMLGADSDRRLCVIQLNRL
jgi:hypothetical protein